MIVARRAPPECFSIDSGTFQVRSAVSTTFAKAAPALPLEEMSVDCFPLVGELYGRPDRWRVFPRLIDHSTFSSVLELISPSTRYSRAASGIQPSGMHPHTGSGRARVRRRRPAPSLVCHDRGPLRTCGPCASRGAQAGGVRPLPPPATRWYRGAARPYTVPRRTRRRGAPGLTVWGRRRTGACCAR